MKLRYLTSLVLGLGLSAQASAANITVHVTNLTQNMVFTPLLVSAHGGDMHVFEVGQMASSGLMAMAEGGDLAGLITATESAGAMNLVNPAEGPLMPATATDAMMLDTGLNGFLSIVAMILPTNDGFVGLDAWPIPSAPGTYTIMLNGYDAGTEANDELVVANGGMPGTPGIPDAPLFEHGENGTGLTTVLPNMAVHIHPGNIGDSDLQGGASDLSAPVHRWLNPVAKVTITVN